MKDGIAREMIRAIITLRQELKLRLWSCTCGQRNDIQNRTCIRCGSTIRASK